MSEVIAVAMSGGVDSSVVAGMLHRQGARVIGLTMQLWNQRRLPELATDKPTGRCCSLDDVYDARHVAQHLGIPYYVVNFEDRFEQRTCSASSFAQCQANVPAIAHHTLDVATDNGGYQTVRLRQLTPGGVVVMLQ